MYSSKVDFEPVVNPQELLKQVDSELFDAYKSGAQLHVWRNQFPHIWQLSSSNRTKKVIFQWTPGELPPEAFLAFAKKVKTPPLDATAEAETHIFHIGEPAHEAWAYDEAAYQACVQRWERAEICAEEFNSLAGSEQYNFAKLPLNSLAVVRTLKRSGVVPMVPAHVTVYEALCSMGLAKVIPRGYILATELLKKIKIPYSNPAAKTPSQA